MATTTLFGVDDSVLRWPLLHFWADLYSTSGGRNPLGVHQNETLHDAWPGWPLLLLWEGRLHFWGASDPLLGAEIR